MSSWAADQLAANTDRPPEADGPAFGLGAMASRSGQRHVCKLLLRSRTVTSTHRGSCPRGRRIRLERTTVGVEKGTKAVISANSSLYGGLEFNNLRSNFVAEIPGKEFFNSHNCSPKLSRSGCTYLGLAMVPSSTTWQSVPTSSESGAESRSRGPRYFSFARSTSPAEISRSRSRVTSVHMGSVQRTK